MKYSLMLGALCALGAMAEVEPSYVTTWTTTTVTDWTIVTITKTVTVPASTIVEATSTSTAEPKVETTTTTTSTAAPTTTTVPQVKVQDTAPEAVETSTSTAEPTSTVAPEPVAEPSTWSTEWTSTWTSAYTEPATTQTSTSTAEPSATQAPANDYQSNVLFSHNVHRANHSSPDVSWSSDLESSAQVLAARCVYEHDTSINGGGYGQNIGYGTSSDEVGVMISNLMYNDEMGYYTNLYGEATPDMTLFEKWGHFSQIVWKGTTEVGCATVSCPSLGNVDSATAVPFTVCNYSPAGNYDGEYADNVLAPLGKAFYAVE
ncbi:CAP domain-containing protein [Aspergillus stella-maris]|uniref:CAP domain-containing protein n=1 Tax=Aspergillus stella-maris TaxID=1810926 RepID=UPI003CCCA03B